MKTGYDQFFKQARKATDKGKPVHRKSAMSTEQLSQEVERQLRQKVGVKPKVKKKTVSIKAGFVSLLGIVVCIAAAIQHEKVELFLQNFEITLLGQAQAETKPVEVKKDSASKEKHEPKAETKGEEGESKGVEGGIAKVEDTSHLQKLIERKKQLDDREAELARTEDEIAKQKEEVEKRMKELEEMRGKISSILEERVKLDEGKVDGLMQMYSNMKPPQAAKVFESMDEELAVEILGRMKKKNAAEILNLLKPEKAQAISEKYAGFRRQTASVNTNKEGKP